MELNVQIIQAGKVMESDLVLESDGE